MSQIELARSPKEKQLLSGNAIADKNLRQNYRSAIALCFVIEGDRPIMEPVSHQVRRCLNAHD
ncbi:MAG: hypothetical protein GPI96_17620 [Microcystis aeruginosa BS13-02]|uniref:Uncharacterized protein n=1 Tax=Microcystis aeruginosa Ma_MB_S_20031200_S102 TaxID=2486254 RepID=A0A552EHV5_MICAE|nr:hypothetical protein [Microcystis aeruginosa BS13-02]TRU27272.1 MAG: hypothetical protein EWV79_04370 [Microcystis aeruginosa Ma_MB_S_20031200_S102D]TRU34060.1 MAG: hypothetical protein EWV92_15970 [Microcystis aeruginosa Ma_MB_S_20031200_S102]